LVIGVLGLWMLVHGWLPQAGIDEFAGEDEVKVPRFEMEELEKVGRLLHQASKRNS